MTEPSQPIYSSEAKISEFCHVFYVFWNRQLLNLHTHINRSNKVLPQSNVINNITIHKALYLYRAQEDLASVTTSHYLPVECQCHKNLKKMREVVHCHIESYCTSPRRKENRLDFEILGGNLLYYYVLEVTCNFIVIYLSYFFIFSL